MTKVKVRSYTSPTLVLLAFDWDDGGERDDFLGFAIEREPGFQGQKKSWLPNRIGFNGPEKGKDFPCNKNPIQKFMWWDAQINDKDHEKTFTYTVSPVAEPPDDPQLLSDFASSIEVTLPPTENQGIGSYFNRAVVSSQAFSKKFVPVTSGNLENALKWLANGLEAVIPEFISGSLDCQGAIYHLTDEHWVIPAFKNYGGNLSLVYNSTSSDQANADAVRTLEPNPRTQLIPRTKANIMHNKFLVKFTDGFPSDVLMGSANFTTDGLSTQANVLHTFHSRELAELYLERKNLLAENPKLAKTAGGAAWSQPVTVGNAEVRVFFSPEPKNCRTSIDEVVSSVKQADKSVVFCLFSPTDKELRDAIFDAGDAGKMMFGLVNSISSKEPSAETGGNAAEVASVALYSRSRNKKDVYSHSLYPKEDCPEGFWYENALLPGKAAKFPVYIHHKFVVVDAETNNPILFTGSANMSGNSLYNNDENLLEIKGSPELATLYLAEFFRLFEHYKARAVWNLWNKAHGEGKKFTRYELKKNKDWKKKYYDPQKPECKSRINMAP